MFRSIVVAVILGAASTAAAQTPVEVQVSQDTLRQLQVFENSLRTAIERAGAQLADRARQVVADISLRLENQPKVVGVVLPEGEGVQFLVEVPAIEASSVSLWEAYRRMGQPPNQLPRIANPANPAPPPVSPAGAPGPAITNPEREYSEFTRQALVDTLLDQAFALPIRETQTLTLIVGVSASGPANPLEAIPRKLYLRMKGDDLIALRQNRITRDEARRRILEFRY